MMPEDQRHNLSLLWVPSMGCSPAGAGCCSVGPQHGHKSCHQTCSIMGSFLSIAPDQTLLQCGVLAFFRCNHLLRRGFLHGLQVGICSAITSVHCRGSVCCLSMSCSGVSAPVHLPSPFSLGAHIAASSTSYLCCRFLLSLLQVSPQFLFSPFSNMLL